MIFYKMPMPPSENESYRSIQARGRIIRCAAKCLRDYQKAMEVYRLENLSQVNEFKRLHVAKLSENQKPLMVSRYFIFHKSRIWTLAGLPKKLDPTNRIKAFDDAFFNSVLGIDDKWVFQGTETKLTCEDPKDEGVIASVEPTESGCYEEIA